MGVISNCFCHDPCIRSPRANALYLKCRVRPGAIVCIHDRPWTPETLRRALPRLANKGMKLTTLSGLHAAVKKSTSDTDPDLCKGRIASGPRPGVVGRPLHAGPILRFEAWNV